MSKKGRFFDFLNRRRGVDFDAFLRTHRPYEHYVDLHGYVLPFDYGDAALEYRALRTSCAMFDASSSRRYRVRGRGAGKFLDHLLTRPVSQSPPMRGIYAVFCNEDGTLKDDVIVYKYAADDYLLMPAFNHDAHFERVRSSYGIEDVSIVHCSESLAGLSLQGPASAAILRYAGFEGIETLRPFDIATHRLEGGRAELARMGFTGDLGYECWFEPELCEVIAQRIEAASRSLDIELVGFGLGALEVCRLEAGFVVPGRECATEYSPRVGMERSPFELGLGWLVKFDDRDFVAREALERHRDRGPRFALRSFQMEGERRLPRCSPLYAAVDGNDAPIGVMTSAAWSWGLRQTIGHASVGQRYAECGEGCVYIGEERAAVKLSRGPLLSFARRAEVPAPILPR